MKKSEIILSVGVALTICAIPLMISVLWLMDIAWGEGGRYLCPACAPELWARARMLKNMTRRELFTFFAPRVLAPATLLATGTAGIIYSRILKIKISSSTENHVKE